MKLINGIKKLLELRHVSETAAVIRQIQQEQYVLNLLTTERYKDSRHLARFENQIFSRHGADGIIGEIFKRIGVTSKVFIEIGCGNGLENNTANLLWCGWSGFWFDGDLANINAVNKHLTHYIAQGKLSARQAFFTAENVPGVMKEAGVPGEFDLLSLDVDRNTYYIWEALRSYHPRVAVIEYNSKVLPSCDWKVEYDSQKVWNGTNYMGASLKALENLGRELGYYLVGCDLVGADCFFIRNDIDKAHFLGPYTAEQHYEPPRFYLLRNSGHRNCFAD
jgi:hypothetical protein